MYGYKIVNGEAVVYESEAAVIINIFNGYLSGMSLRDASVNAGKPMVHSMVKRIIRNSCYVGDEFYPAIISRQTFARANAELIRRQKSILKENVCKLRHSIRSSAFLNRRCIMMILSGKLNTSTVLSR
ncbi:MAG: integrase [Ruminococcus sp.]|nr:integrase [Ruminococcus sp.]